MRATEGPAFTADLYRPNAQLTPERQGYQVLTPFGKLGYSRILTFAVGHWRRQPPSGPSHLVVTIPGRPGGIESGWSKAIEVERLPDDEEYPVVVDMDPVADLARIFDFAVVP